ncbi:MAG: cation transporter [Bacteroidales bacterium]
MKEVKVLVEGMTCNHCKMNVENSIRSVAGITGSEADLTTGVVTVYGDKIDLAKIKDAVESAGYTFSGIKH